MKTLLHNRGGGATVCTTEGEGLQSAQQSGEATVCTKEGEGLQST